MTKIELNSLPEWSPWPSRLLGLTKWKVPNRSIQKVDREYDKDKYSKCLQYYSENREEITLEALKIFELGQNVTDTICVSRGNDLVLMSLRDARLMFYRLLVEMMRHEIEKSRTVIELGCGYGYNLWMLKQHFQNSHFLGGEYSTNAVKLGTNAFRDVAAINLALFNFYDRNYKILEDVAAPVTIFTSHAIEQLPKSDCFFEALFKYRDKIRTVFHFEPVYELYDNTLLGLMQQRYTEINDYNLDLLYQIKRQSDYIRILRIEANVCGMNPLNPTSIINWKFIL